MAVNVPEPTKITTVGELIKQLKKYPKQAEVVTDDGVVRRNPEAEWYPYDPEDEPVNKRVVIW